MGQAWCKEKASKAQDSKSSLDRVFVRCAHRLYPSLKEDGSVFGGATQRVTSSEIGYAGSPPRHVLIRGRSIDSVDRPFQPSDWVDVNLEVPNTPRPSSVLTNLTVDTSLYPTTTPTSSCSNIKDVTPIPPPRRKKRNRGRPLPPKPDEIIPESTISGNLKRVDTSEDPLYTSLRPPNTTDEDNDNHETNEKILTDDSITRTTNVSDSLLEIKATKLDGGRRPKEIFEHKVNGTGYVIPSDVVSGKKLPPIMDGNRRTGKINGSNQQQTEYERFAKTRTDQNSSTPNRYEDKISRMQNQRFEDPSSAKKMLKQRTSSLPNYEELNATSEYYNNKTTNKRGAEDISNCIKRKSTGSIPAEPFLSQETNTRRNSVPQNVSNNAEILSYRIAEKLNSGEDTVDGKFSKYDPCEIKDLGDVGNCKSDHRERSYQTSPTPEIIVTMTSSRRSSTSEDCVDFPRISEIDHFEREIPSPSLLMEKPEGFGKTPIVVREKDSTASSTTNLEDWVVVRNRSPGYFEPPTMEQVCQSSSSYSNDSTKQTSKREPFFLTDENYRSRLNTIEDPCRNGMVLEFNRSNSSGEGIFETELYNDEFHNERDEKDTVGIDSTLPGRLIKTISEESLPREMLEDVDEEEEEEEEQQQQQQQENDFFEEKTTTTKDKIHQETTENSRINLKTPPPSPEPKIRAEILDNDHSVLLRVLREEAADESNLSSMTPSLTELEVALSDMLEKEDLEDDTVKTTDNNNKDDSTINSIGLIPQEKLIEPEIVPVEKPLSKDESSSSSRKMMMMNPFKTDIDDEMNISQGYNPFKENLVDASFTKEEKKEKEDTKKEVSESFWSNKKVSFYPWEESNPMEEITLDVKGPIFEEGAIAATATTSTPNAATAATNILSEKVIDEREKNSENSHVYQDLKTKAMLLDEAPEKPSRLFKINPEESCVEKTDNIPTPPRRKRRSSSGAGPLEKIENKIQQNRSDEHIYSNDRLI